MEQPEREAQISLFKTGEIRVLVSTGVASRGIDLPKIDVVVNFDVPDVPKEYIHRSGRAGRANRAGVAVTFVNQEDLQAYLRLEQFLKRELPKKEMEEESIEKWVRAAEQAKEEAIEAYKKASRENKK
jgi:superfamily II DNA/RNA helicase